MKTSEETPAQLNIRIGLNVMSEQINIRLRDFDDPEDIRKMLRGLLGSITHLQRHYITIPIRDEK